MLNFLIDDWNNAYNLHILDPENFTIPSTNDLNNLVISDLVKISNKVERFWVEITEINKDYLLGKIDNHLTFNDKYDYNDIILFEKNNIYSIHNNIDSEIIQKHIEEYLIKKKKN